MPGWEQLGMQAAGSAVNAGMGLLLQGVNDRRQLRQQEKLQNLQIAGNKQLTDYNFAKQMEMWKNTNYPAQMAMLKAAGLNPALIYENGGMGAQTNITQGNITGGQAPTGGQEIPQMMAMGLTRELQQAQIENIKAQTDKTRAEVPKIGAEINSINQAITESIERIGNIKQQTKNLQAQEQLTNLESGLKQLQQQYESATIQDRIKLLNTTLQQAQQSLRLITTDADINDETKQNQIKQVEASLFLTYAQTRLATSAKHLTDQQIQTEQAKLNQIAAQIVQGARRLDIDKMNAETHRTEQWHRTTEVEDPIGDLLDKVGFLLPIPGLKSRPNEVGFKRKN